MNKKLFLGMFAAAGMLLATSCSNDELDVVQSGNEAQVSFSLGLEGGIATRAISDGKSADVLVYAVFDKDGNRLSNIQAVTKTGVTFPTTESITLAKGQTYKVAFWAQDDDCEAYTVDTDKMSVVVNYANDENKVNNDETRDAFFKTVEFTVTGSTSIDVEMKRPFAQINVGVTKEDWKAAVASGIEIGSSSVVIKNAATSLNLLDGTVNGSTEVSYALNAIPNDPAILKVDANGDGEDEEYNWLSMSYILPAAEQTGYEKATLENIAFVFAPKNNSYSNIEFNQGLNSVPVQRNWRTNILGKILTGDIQFNIEIDQRFDDNYNLMYPDKDDNSTAVFNVTNATELQTALNNATDGAVIYFANDITGDVTATQKPNVKVSILGQGYSFKGVITVDGKSATYTTAGLTIKDVVFDAQTISADACINLGKSGDNNTRYTCNVTVENCTFDVVDAVGIKSYTGGDKNLTITGCTATANAHSLVQVAGIDGILIENSTIKSVRGMNFNSSTNVTVDNCSVDVQKYAVRFGASSGGSGETEVYTIKNSSLKSVNVDDDAVIVLRGTADNSILTIENTTIEGTPEITNDAVGSTVIIDNAATVGTANGVNYALSQGYTTVFAEDVAAPLANSAIYGTPVAVVMKEGGVLDGNGFSLDIENPQYNGYAVETYGGTIKNLTIDTPVGRGIVISSPKQDIYIDNVVVDGPGYAINTTEHNGKNLIVTNSTVKGWTSLAGLDAVSFTKCNFGENSSKYWQNNGYDQDYDRLIRPYVSTTFTECVFEKGYYLDLSALAANAKITLKDCVCGGVEITAENYNTYISVELPANRTLTDCVAFE